MSERVQPRREAPLWMTVVATVALLAACWVIEWERSWRCR